MGWTLVIAVALTAIALVHLLMLRVPEDEPERDPEAKFIDVRGAAAAIRHQRHVHPADEVVERGEDDQREQPRHCTDRRRRTTHVDELRTHNGRCSFARADDALACSYRIRRRLS
jgi:hypothetical protein